MKIRIVVLLSIIFNSTIFATEDDQLVLVTKNYTNLQTVNAEVRPVLKELCALCKVPYNDNKELFKFTAALNYGDINLIIRIINEVHRASTTNSSFNYRHWSGQNPQLFKKLCQLIHKCLPDQEKAILETYLKINKRKEKLLKIGCIISSIVFLACLTVMITHISLVVSGKDSKIPSAIFGFASIGLIISLIAHIPLWGNLACTYDCLQDRIKLLQELLNQLQNTPPNEVVISQPTIE